MPLVEVDNVEENVLNSLGEVEVVVVREEVVDEVDDALDGFDGIDDIGECVGTKEGLVVV